MLIIGTQLENMSSRKDRTWKLVFGTQELTPEKVEQLSQALNKCVFMALKEDEFRQEEEDIISRLESDGEETGKSQSQRIRGVLFILYKKDPEGFNNFESYYNHKTEKYIDMLKKQIDKVL